MKFILNFFFFMFLFIFLLIFVVCENDVMSIVSEIVLKIMDDIVIIGYYVDGVIELLLFLDEVE